MENGNYHSSGNTTVNVMLPLFTAFSETMSEQCAAQVPKCELLTPSWLASCLAVLNFRQTRMTSFYQYGMMIIIILLIIIPRTIFIVLLSAPATVYCDSITLIFACIIIIIIMTTWFI